MLRFVTAGLYCVSWTFQNFALYLITTSAALNRFVRQESSCMSTVRYRAHVHTGAAYANDPAVSFSTFVSAQLQLSDGVTYEPRRISLCARVLWFQGCPAGSTLRHVENESRKLWCSRRPQGPGLGTTCPIRTAAKPQPSLYILLRLPAPLESDSPWIFWRQRKTLQKMCCTVTCLVSQSFSWHGYDENYMFLMYCDKRDQM